MGREWKRPRERLYRLILSALEGGAGPVNLSRPRHTVTTPVLRRYAYDPAFRGKSIPVVFQDGSQPPPFPIGRFSPSPDPASEDESSVLKLGLGSARHPDLDYLVDLYVARSKELADEATMAGEEAYTFRQAVELLSEPVLDEGGRIWVYHTGLEPMIVGFYRGVVHVLEERRRRSLGPLVIRPWLYIGEQDEGPFTPESPGARASSYVSCPPWW